MGEVDKCRPYFVGFLGERYGWAQNEGFPHDRSLEKAFQHATKRHPWLDKLRDRSITELEIIYGALRPQLSPFYDPQAPSRSFFFLRDALSITKHFELGDPQRDNYEEESSDGHRKLRELKETIRASGLPLVDGYTRDQLQSLLVESFTRVINEDFPADEPAACIRSEIESACTGGVFQPVKRLHQQLNDLVLKKGLQGVNQSPLTISGAQGSGKRTFVVQWMRERAAQKAKELLVVQSIPLKNSSAFETASALLQKLSVSFSLSSFELESSFHSDQIR